MELQSATQTTYSNQKTEDINTSLTEKKFQLENKIHESKYTESAKDMTDSKNDNELTNGIFPSGIKLTDEFTDALLATTKELSKSGMPPLMMLMMLSTPTLDDRRYYNHDTGMPVLKNDPNNPINEYGKENFKSNEAILNMLNKIVQDLDEGEKPTSEFINTTRNGYEILISNFNKEISKSEDEKNAQLKNITKNNKPNPLIDIE